MHRLMILPMAIAPLLAACEPVPARDRVAANICQSPANVAALVGRNVGELNFARDLIRREVLPSQPVTEDYNPDRLTIYLDDKGWITRAECV